MRTEHEWIEQALTTLQQGELAMAETMVTHLLATSPDRPALHTLLGMIRAEEKRYAEALICYQRAMANAPAYPDSFQKAASLCHTLGRQAEAEGYLRLLSRPKMRKSFTMLLLCHGDKPRDSLRTLDSILSESDGPVYCNLHVGLNQCPPRVSRAIQNHYRQGRLDLLVHSRGDLFKDPMWRILQDSVNTPYIFWLDDDLRLRPGWGRAIQNFIEQMAPFDVAGLLRERQESPNYATLAHHRPWFDPKKQGQRRYAIGRAFLARTEFLHHHEFPDRQMVQQEDDLLLGELIEQTGGRMVPFSEELLRCCRLDKGI